MDEVGTDADLALQSLEELKGELTRFILDRMMADGHAEADQGNAKRLGTPGETGSSV